MARRVAWVVVVAELLVVISIAWCQSGASCNAADLRLVGGASSFSGRLEICLDGVWGTVCSNGWDGVDASIACRQLRANATTLVTNIYYDGAESHQLIHIDEVNCTGHEDALAECQVADNHNCADHTEDVGIICSIPHQECNDSDIRLQDGPGGSEREGRVEVCVGGVWGTVCDNNWDTLDAFVACKQLEMLTYNPVLLSPVFGELAIPVVKSRLECLGNEERLADCAAASQISNCTHHNDAGVRCTGSTQPQCNGAEVRLVDGVDFHEGRVEVCQLGLWGTVCYDLWWDGVDASVVCRQMGYLGGLSAPFDQRVERTPRVLSNAACVGTENHLLDCIHTSFPSDCLDSRDAGVICQAPECIDGDIRLTGGALQNSSGQVEVCQFRAWGVVCDDSWDSVDATVVCRQFGFIFGTAVSDSSFGVGPIRPIFLDDVRCNGSEATLLECTHNEVGIHNCDHSEHAGVRCSNTAPNCVDGDVQLTGGGSQHSRGQVVLCYNREWGAVCDDLWDARDATVVCRQLGYIFGEAIRGSFFAIGNATSILLDDTDCDGSEASLLSCQHRAIGGHNCDNTEHAGVRCSSVFLNSRCEDFEIRLVDGTGVNDGRVEVCQYGQWETVCSNSWTDNEATLACRQLELTSVGVVGFFGNREDSYFRFDCNEHSSLSECPTMQLLVPCPGQNAGVSCIDRKATDCNEGMIRLISGGISDQFGRVEVCHENIWGTVCDNSWDDADARVVCKQLNSSYTSGSAIRKSAFRFSPLRPIILDEVGCVGTESNLVDCPHNGFTNHECSSNQYAGVVCDNGIQERCSEDENRTLNVTKQLESTTFGTCEPYTGGSELCSDVYKGYGSVYVLASTKQTQLTSQLDSLITRNLFEDRCAETIVTILCLYFLPPCGANSTTYLPITVCREECVQVQDACPRDWIILQEILASNGMGGINCFSTQAAVNPLPSCCTGAGIQAKSPGTPAITGSLVGSVAILLVVMFILVMILLAAVYRRIQKRKGRRIRQRNLRGVRQHDRFVGSRLDGIRLNTYSSSGSHNATQSPAAPLQHTDSELGRSMLSQFRRELSENFEVEISQLKVQEVIGSGEFGVVFKALYTEEGGETAKTVAAKTLKGKYGSNEVHKLMKESAKMKFFDHPNVLSLIGVCLDMEPAPYIIVPFMVNGSLHHYLEKEEDSLFLKEHSSKIVVEDVKRRLTLMCWHIAKGMEYLAEQRFIHRDLAARNCMIDANYVIKIADFGLSEDLYTENYFLQGEHDSIKLPVKWMAPESLNKGRFSEKSDVWSYGVTCWEIFSAGRIPYAGLDHRSIMKMLEKQERLDKPNNAACPSHMYGVMEECWEADARDRPTFSELVVSVFTFVNHLAGYVNFSDCFEASVHHSQFSNEQASSVLSNTAVDNRSMQVGAGNENHCRQTERAQSIGPQFKRNRNVANTETMVKLDERVETREDGFHTTRF